jgi:hypothetical protein
MKRLLAFQTIVSIFILLVIAGCATKSVEPPSQATLQTRNLKPSPGKALVYYYNHKRFLGVPNVSLDEMSSEIEKGTYVLWEVEPGTYHLEFTHTQAVFVETVELDITCQADQIYYFQMLGHDRETHKIGQVDNETGRTKIEQFRLTNWFQDGELVTEDEPSQKAE